MEIKSRFFIFVVLLLLLGHSVFCQTKPPAGTKTADASSYFIRETEAGKRFFQRISWREVPGIFRYEIILDKRAEDSEQYNGFLRESAVEPFIELSLPSGNYRYKILGYNVLNRVGAESGYIHFEVLRAFQPEIREISPNQLFLDDKDSRGVTLIGEHFLSGSNIYLVPVKKNETDNSKNQPGVIAPSEINYSGAGDTAELVFDRQNLDADTFRIVVENPGGLTGTYEYLDIKRFKKPRDLNVSLGYAPLLPVSSGSELTELLDMPVYPLGFTAKLSFIAFKTQYGFFGAELSPFFTNVTSEQDFYTVKTNILGAALSVLYQKPFLDNKLFVNARLGGGVFSYAVLQFEYNSESESKPLSVIFPGAQASVSAQYFVYKTAFVEFGLDFKLFFAKDMLTPYLSPALTAGWQF